MWSSKTYRRTSCRTHAHGLSLSSNGSMHSVISCGARNPTPREIAPHVKLLITTSTYESSVVHMTTTIIPVTRFIHVGHPIPTTRGYSLTFPWTRTKDLFQNKTKNESSKGSLYSPPSAMYGAGMLMFMTPARQGPSSNAIMRGVLYCVLLRTCLTNPASVANAPPQLWTARWHFFMCRQVFLPCFVACGISRTVLENWIFSLAKVHGLVRRVRTRTYYSIPHIAFLLCTM